MHETRKTHPDSASCQERVELRLFMGERELGVVKVPFPADPKADGGAAQLRGLWESMAGRERLRAYTSDGAAFAWAFGTVDRIGYFNRSVWTSLTTVESWRLSALGAGYLIVHSLGARWATSVAAHAAYFVCELATATRRHPILGKAQEQHAPELSQVKLAMLQLDDIERKLSALMKQIESAGVTRPRLAAQAVLQTQSPILFVGPSGVGKSTLAHALAKELKKTIVTQDCGRLSGDQSESELFGHVRGAFTDAKTKREGKLRAAHDAVLFLDEVQNLTPATQQRLLDALQRKCFAPLGSNVEERSDFRLFSATSLSRRDIEMQLADPFWNRVASHVIEFPRWRDRTPEHRRVLVEEIVTRAYERVSVSESRRNQVTSVAVAVLSQPIDIPGELRQLQARIEELLLVSHDRDVTEHDVVVACVLGVRDAVRVGPPPPGENALVDVFRALRDNVSLSSLAGAAYPGLFRNNERATIERVRRELGPYSIKQLKRWRDAGEL